MIDGELGAFLRNRRESVRPSDVGIPEGPRRRTPGLRRAELATLAGVSVDYLTRLEQGRDGHPSAQVLAALADALRLSDDDAEHLRGLAVISNFRPRTQPATARTVRDGVRALLAQLEPAPAVVLNNLGDQLAWTAGYDRLARPLGLLDDPPNVLWFTFTDPRARAGYPDWDEIADAQVADLHALRHGDADVDAYAAHLAHEGGAAFADRWERRPLGVRRTGVTAVVHPAAGALRLAFETLDLSDPDLQRLLVYRPADAATASALDRLAMPL